MNIKNQLAGLRTFPYVNARVRAMRENLLSSNDYRKLEKMAPAEILETLQQGDYKEDINRFSGEESDIDLLEKALDHHLARIYEKLMRISPDLIQDLLRAYFARIDIENIKTVLRHTRRDRDQDLTDMLLPTHDMPEGRLTGLAAMESIEDILAAVEVPGGGTLIEHVDPDATLEEMEYALDRAYYRHLLDVADDIPAQGQLFREFLELEVRTKNIGLVLRLKKHGFDPQDIQDQILDLSDGRIDNDLRELILADDYEDALGLVREQDAGSHIDQGMTDITDVEQALQRHKLERGTEMLHREPLSINPVLGYMIGKQVEVANLRIILQANKANLGQAFMDRNLIRGVKER